MTETKPLSEIERQVLSIRLDAALKLASAVRRLDVSGMDAWKTAVEGTLASGVSQEDLSRRLCCSVSTIGRWESGHSAPAPTTRANIRDAMADMIDEWASAAHARLAAGPEDEPEASVPSM